MGKSEKGEVRQKSGLVSQPEKCPEGWGHRDGTPGKAWAGRAASLETSRHELLAVHLLHLRPCVLPRSSPPPPGCSASCPVRSLPSRTPLAVLTGNVLLFLSKTQKALDVSPRIPSLHLPGHQAQELGELLQGPCHRRPVHPPLSELSLWWVRGPVTTGQCRAPALGWCCCYPGGTERRPKTRLFALAQLLGHDYCQEVAGRARRWPWCAWRWPVHMQVARCVERWPAHGVWLCCTSPSFHRRLKAAGLSFPLHASPPCGCLEPRSRWDRSPGPGSRLASWLH